MLYFGEAVSAFSKESFYHSIIMELYRYNITKFSPLRIIY